MNTIVAVWIGEVNIPSREHYLILLLAAAILLHNSGVIQWLSLVVTQYSGTVPHLEHTFYYWYAIILCRILTIVGEDNKVHLLKPHRFDRSAEAVKLCQLDVS